MDPVPKMTLKKMYKDEVQSFEQRIYFHGTTNRQMIPLDPLGSRDIDVFPDRKDEHVP